MLPCVDDSSHHMFQPSPIEVLSHIVPGMKDWALTNKERQYRYFLPVLVSFSAEVIKYPETSTPSPGWEVGEGVESDFSLQF